MEFHTNVVPINLFFSKQEELTKEYNYVSCNHFWHFPAFTSCIIYCFLLIIHVGMWKATPQDGAVCLKDFQSFVGGKRAKMALLNYRESVRL